MIEIGLGVLAIVSALAIVLGLTDGWVPFPLGSGAIATAILLGLALILRGAYRLARRRTGANTQALRSLGLAAVISLLTLVIALAMPSLSEPLNLITLAGFPLGLYMMAQGTVLLFAVLLFVFAVKQSRIDEAGDP